MSDMNFWDSMTSPALAERPSGLFIGLVVAGVASVALWGSLIAGYVLIG